MERVELLERMQTMLEGAFGTRLRGVVLYGSEARGDAGPDSDIDLLVLLDGPPETPRDTEAAITALYPLVLELGRPIHAEPVDSSVYESSMFPLYRSARREGVVLRR